MEAAAQAGSIATNAAPSTMQTNTQKTFKRKFEEAMQNLDMAVGRATIDVAQPSKRPKLSKSLYSTLAKYGIQRESKASSSEVTTLDGLAKNAPHFAAMISRSMSRKRKPNPFQTRQSPSPVPNAAATPGSDYRPSSTASFIARLATYKLTTYANKPPAIDAVAAAKCGWINDGKDRLVCGICSSSWVVGGTSGMSKDAANALVEKQRASLVDMHKNGCPWKTRQCESSIYRVSLQMPAAMIRELKARATKLDIVMKDVHIKHPLTSVQTQQYLSILHAVKLRSLSNSSETSPTEAESSLPEQEPADNVMITALFGWSVVVPTEPDKPSRRSVSRSNSVAPSISAAPTRLAMPSASPLRNSSISVAPLRPSRSISSRLPSSTSISAPGLARVKPDATLLFCPLCQRRVGLWAFLPSSSTNGEQVPLPSGPSLAGESHTQPRRQFDVLKEHRSYCPYVVRSTLLPTLPVSPPPIVASPARPFMTGANSSLTQVNAQPGAIEGWRAVLTVVLRHGSAQRHRFGRSRSLRGSAPQGPEAGDIGADWVDAAAEVSQVDDMVESVKTRGGKDLLKYVKGLLG